MRIGGGGPGFDYPAGDPGAIDAAAGALNSAAGDLRTAAGQVNREGMALRGSWCGPAALAFEAAVQSVQGGLDALAGHHEDGASALTTYATALREAQLAAEQAAVAYGGAEQAYNTSMADLAGHPARGAVAQAAQVQVEGQAVDRLSAAYGSASAASTQACEHATLAAQACAARVSQIAADMRETALHRFLDLMGGPSTALGSLGVVMQAKSLMALRSLVRAMETGNWDAVDAADPKGYQEVLDVVEKYGPNSAQATKAWMKYESDVAGDAFSDTVKTAIPIGDVPSGAAGVLDVLGKIGFVASIAGDAMTIGDSQSTDMEGAMAATNLGGVALASGGVTVDAATGATVLTALGATDAVATVVPIVGEVVIAATAAYFAYDWTSTHWQDVVNWTHDAAKGLSTAYHAVVNVGDGAVHEGEHLLQSGWHDVTSLAGDLGF